MNERLPYHRVLPIARDFAASLTKFAADVQVAGSLRREADTVKDVELVVRNPFASFYSHLDHLVTAGTISRADYGGSQRWGMKYRGLVYQGIRFELFCADDDNFGFQHWLRTGPGQANTFAMTSIAMRDAPFRFQEGYGWMGDWKRVDGKWIDPQRRKLRLATEEDVFDLLGLPFIPPQERDLLRYLPLKRRDRHSWGDPTKYLTDEPAASQDAAPVQSALFEMNESKRFRYE